MPALAFAPGAESSAPARGPLGLQPPPGHRRFAAADGLRGLAAVTVVVVHAGVTDHAAPGTLASLRLHLELAVTVFFVLSGFLLFRPFAASRLEGATPVSLRAYARRRILRIFPAYWLALSVLTLYPGLWGVRERPAAFFGLAQSIPWTTAELGCAGPCGLPVAWSLSVELGFYLLLPALVLLVDVVARRRPPALWARSAWRVLLVVVVASLACEVGWTQHSAQLDPSWDAVGPFTLASCLGWFAAGMALALLSIGRPDRGPPRRGAWLLRARHAWPLAGAAFLAIGLTMPVPSATLPEFLGRRVGYAFVATLVVAPALLGRGDRLVRAVLCNRVVRWLGTVSYGIYLWHTGVLTMLQRWGVATGLGHAALAARAVLALALSTAAAAVSYRLVERPFLRLKERPRAAGRGRAAPALAAGLALVAAAVAVAVGPAGTTTASSRFASPAAGVTFRVPGHLRLADHFASPAGGLISFRGQGVALVLQEHPLLDANRGGESLGLAAAVRDARALALPGTARVWRVRIGSLWGTRVRTALAVPTNGYREVAMLFGQRRSYILECLGQPLFQQVARRACDELLTTLRAA